MKIFNYPLFAFIAIIGFACSTKSQEKNEKQEAKQPVVRAQEKLQSNYFHAPQLPDTIKFADEVLALSDLDIKERFDRELIVNNFWHSNTFFYLKRANRWFPVMKPILEEHNIPLDFLYLAVIESGLMQVTSPSGAKGFWQFLKGTAQDYGLIVNNYIDERMNIEKSTVAACEYLQKSYEEFGSWSLAAAAYNRGKAGISRILESQNVDNFYDLYLNEETSRYVFRIIAAKYILENPEEFGFMIEDNQLYPPYKIKKVEIEENISDLVEWAKDNDINYKILKTLNPWILQKQLFIPKDASIFINLPADKEQLNSFEVITR